MEVSCNTVEADIFAEGLISFAVVFAAVHTLQTITGAIVYFVPFANPMYTLKRDLIICFEFSLD